MRDCEAESELDSETDWLPDCDGDEELEGEALSVSEGESEDVCDTDSEFVDE